MFFPIAMFIVFAAVGIAAVAFLAVCLEDLSDERKHRARILR